MPCFPMFVDLKGKRILVLGGGKVALRKVKKLQPFGGKINVVAPRVEPELEAIPGLEISRHPFRLSDLWPRPELVIAATDDRAVNHAVGEEARSLGIPVSVADCEQECTFYFPAVCTGENLVAGVVSTGRDHHRTARAAREIRKVLEELK